MEAVTYKTSLILFFGVLALSTSAIFVRIADAPSAVMAFYRLMIAATVLLPFYLAASKCKTETYGLKARQWGQIILAGFFLALHYLLWFESLRFTSVASSTVIVCLQPLFSLTLDRFISRKKIPLATIVGCIVALVGCAVIGTGDFEISGNSLWGDILAFIAAGIIALYFFVGENIRKKISAVTYSLFSYFLSAVILLIYMLIKQDSLLGYSVETWLAFWGLAVVSTIGGQFVFNLILKNVPASAVTMSILGEPIGTCILAYFLLGERIGNQQMAGIAIIMTGMAIFFSSRQAHQS